MAWHASFNVQNFTSSRLPYIRDLCYHLSPQRVRVLTELTDVTLLLCQRCFLLDRLRYPHLLTISNHVGVFVVVAIDSATKPLVPGHLKNNLSTCRTYIVHAMSAAAKTKSVSIHTSSLE